LGQVRVSEPHQGPRISNLPAECIAFGSGRDLDLVTEPSSKAAQGHAGTSALARTNRPGLSRYYV